MQHFDVLASEVCEFLIADSLGDSLQDLHAFGVACRPATGDIHFGQSLFGFFRIVPCEHDFAPGADQLGIFASIAASGIQSCDRFLDFAFGDQLFGFEAACCDRVIQLFCVLVRAFEATESSECAEQFDDLQAVRGLIGVDVDRLADIGSRFFVFAEVDVDLTALVQSSADVVVLFCKCGELRQRFVIGLDGIHHASE